MLVTKLGKLKENSKFYLFHLKIYRGRKSDIN